MTKLTAQKSLSIRFYVVAISLLLMTLTSCYGDPFGLTWEERDRVSARQTATAAAATQEAPTLIAEVETHEARVTSEAQATEAAATAQAEEDICSLLPVDVNAIIEESTIREPGYGGSCTANIDYLVGCKACGSKMSITKYPSESEALQSFTYPEDCGRAAVFSEVILKPFALPFGEEGYGCPDSHEEYEEGVAQLYCSIWFTQGPYSVAIWSGFPGVEDLILDLGQDIVNRIESLPDS